MIPHPTMRHLPTQFEDHSILRVYDDATDTCVRRRQCLLKHC